MDRRSFLRGFGTTLLAAPAIVRSTSLMIVKPILDIPQPTWRMINPAKLYVQDSPFGQPQYWEDLIVDSREIERLVLAKLNRLYQ